MLNKIKLDISYLKKNEKAKKRTKLKYQYISIYDFCENKSDK